MIDFDEPFINHTNNSNSNEIFEHLKCYKKSIKSNSKQSRQELTSN